MKKLYEKNELTLALVWIFLYLVLFSLAENLSHTLGMEKAVTAPLCLLFTAALLVWLGRSGLWREYGLCPFRGKSTDYLYFLPLLLLASTNLWNGAALRFSPLETALYVFSMLCVGFIEELVFRGFLFRALCREGTGRAVVISSLTFGLGHIINLLNGADVFSTLLQVCYACAIGFLFTVIFLRGGSLLPCILTHSAVNSLSAFAVEQSDAFGLLTAAILTLVSLGYALWILRRTAPPKSI